MVNRNIFFAFLLTILATSLTSCGVPATVKDAMVSEIENTYDVVDNIRIEQSGMKQLTDAEKANGIEQKWCIKAAFIYQTTDGRWIDGLLGFTGRLQNGEWDFWTSEYFSPFWMGGMETYSQFVDDYYRRCMGLKP